MRGFIITILLIILIAKIIIMSCNCKLQLAKTSVPLSYYSIDKAKENHAFVSEYIPDSPFICIQGKQYDIDEGWIEHPYVQKNFYDKVQYDGYVFSLSFKSDIPYGEIYAGAYIQGIQTNSRIYFYLTDYDKDHDTMIVHYKASLKSPKKDKKLLFFKK